MSNLIECYRELEDVIREAKEHTPRLPVKLPRHLRSRLDDLLNEFSKRLVDEIKPSQNQDPSHTLKDGIHHVTEQAKTQGIQVEKPLVESIVLSALYCRGHIQPTVRSYDIPVYIDDCFPKYMPLGLEIVVGGTSIRDFNLPPRILRALLSGITIAAVGTILAFYINPLILLPTCVGALGCFLSVDCYNLEKHKDQIIKYNFLFRKTIHDNSFF